MQRSGHSAAPMQAAAPAPIVAREHRALHHKCIHQRDQIGADRGLLAGARGRGIKKAGRTVTAQIGDDDAAAFRGEHWRDIHIGVDVIGKTMQQHHGRTIRRSCLEIGDIEHAGLDVAERFQPL